MSGPRFRRRPDVLWRRSLDAVVLLPAVAEEPVTLLGTGPELWELLAEPRTLEDLAEVLAGLHGVDPAVVRADVAPVLADLVALVTVEEVADSGGRKPA